MNKKLKENRTGKKYNMSICGHARKGKRNPCGSKVASYVKVSIATASFRRPRNDHMLTHNPYKESSHHRPIRYTLCAKARGINRLRTFSILAEATTTIPLLTIIIAVLLVDLSENIIITYIPSFLSNSYPVSIPS